MFARLACIVVLVLVMGAGRPQGRQIDVSGPRVAAPRYQDVIRRWQNGDPIRVILIGDSVTLGCCAAGWEKLHQTSEGDSRGSGRLSILDRLTDDSGGLASQLRAMLRARNPESVLINESGDGWDSRMVLGLTRRRPGDPLVDVIADVMKTATPPSDLAFISLGINDFGHGYPYALTGWRDILRQNLLTMVRRLKAGGVVPVLVKTNDIDRIASLADLRWCDYMATLDALASEESIPVVDGYTPFHAAVVNAGGFDESGLMYDYLHPNQAGHDLLFSQFATWFNQALPERRSLSGR